MGRRGTTGDSGGRGRRRKALTIDAPRRDDHPRAALGEDPRRLGPDARRGAGDDGGERGEVRARGRHVLGRRLGAEARRAGGAQQVPHRLQHGRARVGGRREEARLDRGEGGVKAPIRHLYKARGPRMKKLEYYHH